MIEWIFDGIGTEFLSITITVIFSTIFGCVFYKRIINRTVKQNQISGDNSKQIQEINLENDNLYETEVKSKNKFKQSQIAGNNSIQIQIGEVNVSRKTNSKIRR